MGSVSALPGFRGSLVISSAFPRLVTVADLDFRGPQASRRVFGLSVWAEHKENVPLYKGWNHGSSDERGSLEYSDKRPLRGP